MGLLLNHLHVVPAHVRGVLGEAVTTPVAAHVDLPRVPGASQLGHSLPDHRREVTSRAAAGLAAVCVAPICGRRAALHLIVPSRRGDDNVRVAHGQVLPGGASRWCLVVALGVHQGRQRVRPRLSACCRCRAPCQGRHSMHATVDVVRLQSLLSVGGRLQRAEASNRHVPRNALLAGLPVLAELAVVDARGRARAEGAAPADARALRVAPAHAAVAGARRVVALEGGVPVAHAGLAGQRRALRPLGPRLGKAGTSRRAVPRKRQRTADCLKLRGHQAVRHQRNLEIALLRDFQLLLRNDV
mmetsp:Transcript_69067/g.183694  ORF Transcript_69067/g.183694 Transcript_69067/m.183694 type:complete len:300 (+) Transcript_69067:153-1052(+)